MERRNIVVGDVHGCFETMKTLLFDVVKISSNDFIYFLGDLIDRGPRVKQTLDFVIDLWKKNRAIAIRGNHEEMLLNSLSDPTALINWEYNGSRATLESFKVSHPKDIPQVYVFFFESMPFYVELENYILVHGDLDFDAENPFQNTQYLVWGRSRRADPNKTKMRKVVVGHTPTPLNEIIISLNQWKIFLDGGCVYARSIFKQNLGYLCALDLNSNELYYTYCKDF